MKSKILTLGVGAAIAATSFSSCDNSNDFPNLAIASEENFVDDETTAISMKKLSQEEQVYIHDMSLLSHNILNDTNAAEAFLNAPLEYARSLGIKSSIDTDDGTVRFLLAICKPEFREAVIKRDIRRFVELCEKYDIFKNANSSNIKLLNHTAITRSKNCVDVQMGFFWIGEWILLGVAYVGAGIDYAALGGPVVCASRTINSEMALQVWAVETQDGSVYELADEYKNHYVQDLVKLVKEKFYGICVYTGKSGDGGSGQQSGWTAYRYCKKKKWNIFCGCEA